MVFTASLLVAEQKKGIVWRSSRQACLLCPWSRPLTGRLHLYVADKWRARILPDYNCEVAYPGCGKRRLLGAHQWQSVLLVVGLPVNHAWFEMGCQLLNCRSCGTSIPRKRKVNHNNNMLVSTKSQPKSVYSLLRSMACFSSSDFPNCSSPRESASAYADYLRSHFSLFQPKVFRSRTRGYLSELRRAPVSRDCRKLLLVHCHWPRPNNLSYAKASSSLWHGFFSHFQSLLVFAFLFFRLEDIFKYSHSYHEKAFQLISHFRRLKSFLNSSFYRTYFSFWSLTPFSHPARPVSAVNGPL